MKKNNLLLIIGVLITCMCWGQNLDRGTYLFSLNGHVISPVQENQDPARIMKERRFSQPSETKEYCILQFFDIPSVEEQKRLKAKGVELLGYVHGNAYYASVTKEFYRLKSKESKNIRAFIDIKPEYKIAQKIANATIPKYALSAQGSVKVIISYFELPEQSVFSDNMKSVRAGNIRVSEVFNQVYAEVPEQWIKKLATYTWIQNIQLISPPRELLNKELRTSLRGHVLGSNLRGLGYGLTGKGVRVGLWDHDVENHRDYRDRLIQRENTMHITQHGTHICGTIIGAGILDVKARGIAPEATLYSWNLDFNYEWTTPEERVISIEEDKIEIASNSYGSVDNNCPMLVEYNTEDQREDEVCFRYPWFLTVYAAGNSQGFCPDGYYTIAEMKKNTLYVAASDEAGQISKYSSFGPTSDGRLLPNICGVGSDVYSTGFYNSYMYKYGTSMATPGVAGTMVLLYQRFKETNHGARPLSSLMRAIACNTATDYGNPGPDYQFGYGFINGLRAVETMEKKAYFTDSLEHGAVVSKEITVPEGAAGLKVMLAWTDPEAIPGAGKVLVNNLDLKVIHGDEEVLPWVLDPENPANVAVRGVDELNNMEQVTLAAPKAGKYTIRVFGKEVPTGVQEFSLVYEIVMPTLRFTYPINDDKLEPGSTEFIYWECEGYDSPFTLEYSTDGGINYKPIATDIPAGSRSYVWKVPDDNHVSTAKLRISTGKVLDETSGVFHVMTVPQNIKAEKAKCGGTGPFYITWDSVANAKYEILKLNGERFEFLAESLGNSYSVSGLSNSNDNLFCVRAIDLTTGAVSERSRAVEVNPLHSDFSLPFREDFDKQVTPNFYFSNVAGYGKASIKHLFQENSYGIMLEGAIETHYWTNAVWDDWVDAAGEECFEKNPKYVVSTGICNFDASAYRGKKLLLAFDFFQNVVGEGTSWFRVKVNGNTVQDTEGRVVFGDVLPDEAQKLYYDLSAYAGEPSVDIVMEAVCREKFYRRNNNYDVLKVDGDYIFIDNVELKEFGQNDLEMISLQLGEGATDKEPVFVEIINLSGKDVTNIPVSYSINDGNIVWDTIPGPIGHTQKTVFEFRQKADFSKEGKYTVRTQVSEPGDINIQNNEHILTVFREYLSVKITEKDTMNTCNSRFTDGGGIFHNYDDIEDSQITFRPGETGKRMKITFEEFATEEDFDELYIYDGPSTSSPLLAVLSGNQLSPSYVSTAPGGELTFYFWSDAHSSDKGWIANVGCIDYAKVDLSLLEIKSSGSMINEAKTDREEISFKVKNYGTDTIVSYDAFFSLNNGLPVKQSFSTKLAQTEVEENTFDSLVDLSVPGEYNLRVWVEVPEDEVEDNNADSIDMVSLPVVKDVGISSLSLIPSRKKMSPVVVEITNYGTQSLNNFDIAYQTNEEREVIHTITEPLGTGETRTVTFAEVADLSGLNKEYVIKAYIKYPEDAEQENDTISEIINSNPTESNVAANFGNGALVQVTTTTPFNLTNNYTVECWLNVSDYDDIGTMNAVFSKYTIRCMIHKVWENDQIALAGLSLGINDGEYECSVIDVLQLNTWHHVALTVSSDNEYVLYVDGEVLPFDEIEGEAVPAKPNEENDLYIGWQEYGIDSCKQIDEFRMWNTCLDQKTIRENMLTDYAPDTEGLMAYYKFNERKGKYVYDYSSNDNTALVYDADVSGIGAGKFRNEPLLLKDFKIQNEVMPTVFNEESLIYYSVLPEEAELDAVIAEFRTEQNAEVKVNNTIQISGVTENSYVEGPVVFTVQGVGFNKGVTQYHQVQVTKDRNADCELTVYKFTPEDNPDMDSSVIMTKNGSDFWEKAEFGADLTALKARFEASEKARVMIDDIIQTSPQSNYVDYSKPVLVKVLAENERDFKNYSVFWDSRNNQADLINFTIPGITLGKTIVENANSMNTVTVWVKKEADVSALTPTFQVSENAKVYIGSIERFSGISTENFTSPIVYTIVSQDETVETEWEIRVKKDFEKPVISLIGEEVITVHAGSEFNDPGASAIDSIDGNISSYIERSGNVNTNVPGSYKIEYRVVDASGNSANTVSRTVIVVESTQINSAKGKPIRIYSFNNAVYVDIPELKGTGKLVIRDILGKSVYSTANLKQGINCISNDFLPGVYILSLSADNKVYTESITIK